jgi:hypothetical protein
MVQEGKGHTQGSERAKSEVSGTKIMLSLIGNCRKYSRRKSCEKKFRGRYVNEDRED